MHANICVALRASAAQARYNNLFTMLKPFLSLCLSSSYSLYLSQAESSIRKQFDKHLDVFDQPITMHE